MPSIEGNIVNSEGTARGRIEINEASGLIEKVGAPTGKADILLGEELIFPGFIDVHVHARECKDHSQDYKEDFITAGNAAINGGVTAIAEMPNNPVPPIDDASYAEKKKLAEKCPIEVLLYAGIGPNTNPLSKKVPYKAFMGPSVGDLFFRSKEELEETIKRYEGQYVSFHCEDPEVLEANKDKPTHELRRPPEAETSAVDFALELIRKYKLHGKICHASTLAALEKVIEAKKAGMDVKAEITPHHLYFDQGIITDESNKFLQVNPPVRTGKDRLRMIEYLKNGDIDFLATDHAPHTLEEKEKGTSGMPHLDTYGPFVAWLIKEHGFSPAQIAKVCCENPGGFLDNFSEELVGGLASHCLASHNGKIAEGCSASFTILDMQKPITISKDMLKTKCAWSPFEGVTFPGSITKTIVKGKIYEN